MMIMQDDFYIHIPRHIPRAHVYQCGHGRGLLSSRAISYWMSVDGGSGLIFIARKVQRR